LASCSPNTRVTDTLRGNPEAVSLRQRLLTIIDRGAGAPLEDDRFEELAVDVFRHQFELNSPYRAYCRARGATPENVTTWMGIPAVPADAFKAASLLCGDVSMAAATFRTSGTTAGRGRRGTHHFLDTSLYSHALIAGFRHHLVPEGDRIQILSLIPSARAVPDSSLSFMLSEVIASFGAEGSGFFVEADRIRLEPLLTELRRSVAADRPVLLAGTSFAFVHLVDFLEETGTRIHLAPGSRAMDTGGFKGRSREVGRSELYRSLEDRLGIPCASLINEYGMTEMSSQFYDGVAGMAGGPEERFHVGPGWVRTIAVDPETLEPLPEGRPGILRHFDLANLDSVVALQTSDLGRVTPRGFVLTGRAGGAEARGCSLAMEELLKALSTAPGERTRPRPRSSAEP